MFNLVCVHSFGKYTKGQMVTDPAEIEKLQEDREHHFVRVAKSEQPSVEAEPAKISVKAPAPTK